MSTPSKKRRKAREWMQRTAAENQQRIDWMRRDCERRVREEHDRLTRMIPREERQGYDREVFYPQGKIDKPFIRIALHQDLPPALFDRNAAYNAYLYGRMEVIDLRAVQHALVLPDGTKVVWWGWEMAR